MALGAVNRFLSLGIHSDPSLEARRRGGLVNGLSAVGIVFLIGLGSLAAARGVGTLAMADFSAAFLLALLLAFFWSTGRYNAAAHIGVILIGTVFLYLLISGGEDQTAYVWYFAYPLMATFLLGAKRGIVASAVLITFACAYFVIEPLAPGWADYPIAFEIRFVSAFIVVALFSVIYERMRSAAADALAATNEQLRNEVRQRKEAIAEMEVATSEARRANKAKSQFLANMSHELRTPLNHVIGFSEIVLSEKVGMLNDTQREYLGDVVSSSRHLLSIINDVLDLSRVESGKAELTYTETDFQTLLQGSITMVSDQAEQKGVSLTVDVGSLPEKVVIDERMIRQVLYNLLQNAVKFTSTGDSVSISGGVSTVAENMLSVSVHDTGIGIEAQDLELVFDNFQQVGSKNQTNQGGTGLGLALCRRFIELHGGQIWAESDGIGTGATFVFRIPIKPGELT